MSRQVMFVVESLYGSHMFEACPYCHALVGGSDRSSEVERDMQAHCRWHEVTKTQNGEATPSLAPEPEISQAANRVMQAIVGYTFTPAEVGAILEQLEHAARGWSVASK